MTNDRGISRRLLGKLAEGAVLSAAVPSAGLCAPAADSGASARRFPSGFLWGCSTASYQVEGAAAEDGRGPSVWDTFSRLPGRIANGDTGDVAADEYHRYKEDVAILKSLGAKAYRFSVAWPRVVPDGVGKPNQKGIDYYQRLVDELVANGIQPFATLFHWDLPEAMEHRCGGWQSPETSKAFAEYAGMIAGKLSDRVHRFFTINEFVCFTDHGYQDGSKAPGRKLPPAQVNQTRHNAVLAHGWAVQAIRAAARAGTKVGLAENASFCVPVIESEPHINAARKAMRELNAPFLTAVMEGKYTDRYLSRAGKDAPKFTSDEMKAIHSPLDFVGLNAYFPTYIRADGSTDGFAELTPPSSHPRMASPWLSVGPEVEYWAPRMVSDLWKVKEIYISENGCSSDDRPAADGRIYDTDRVMYLRNCLGHAQRAVSEGLPLRGYFLWSLIDNFEWTDGYSKRFGIYYVDFQTQKRTPKLSADFYHEVIRTNRVA
jgi:beta-glucosidase